MGRPVDGRVMDLKPRKTDDDFVRQVGHQEYNSFDVSVNLKQHWNRFHDDRTGLCGGSIGEM